MIKEKLRIKLAIYRFKKTEIIKKLNKQKKRYITFNVKLKLNQF